VIGADELIIDLFAGGGGASAGIEAALGRDVDVAINHDEDAIAVHSANHPRTRHYRESVWRVDPHEATGGRPVGVLWASPDCTHHSRAKGGKPLDAKRRSLASAVVRWAAAVAPRFIFLENVVEWLSWGPLLASGQPDPRRKGRSFRCWLGKLRARGYAVEWRVLNAADFGAPTTRERLFLVARRDGLPVAWPTPTHGKGRLPRRTAAECIDWTLPVPSIFDRARPLAENTLRRIAAGVVRYVLNDPRPFIVKYHGGGAFRGQSLAEPLRTADTSNRFALVAALLTKHYGGVVGHGVQLPLGTVTTQDHHALTTATLSATADDRADRVTAWLTKYYTGGERASAQQQSLFEPLHTVPTRDRFGLVYVHGAPHRIVDIGMRMLRAEELMRAHAFPAGYSLAAARSHAARVRLVGNSVVPALAEAVVRANLGDAPAAREVA
jgi:DNA (cytosine-5)-methyltransferase 1